MENLFLSNDTDQQKVQFLIFFEDYSQRFDDLILQQIGNNFHHYFLDLLLLFYFSTIQENLFMILPFSNLLLEGGNTMNQYYQESILAPSHWFL